VSAGNNRRRLRGEPVLGDIKTLILRGYERERCKHSRTASGRTGDRDPAADRLDAVGQTHEPGSPGRIGTANAIVMDDKCQRRVVSRQLDANERGLRVLDDVRERLGNEVVRRHLDTFRQPELCLQLQLDGEGTAPRQHPERGSEATSRKDSWVNPV